MAHPFELGHLSGVRCWLLCLWRGTSAGTLMKKCPHSHLSFVLFLGPWIRPVLCCITRSFLLFLFPLRQIPLGDKLVVIYFPFWLVRSFFLVVYTKLHHLESFSVEKRASRFCLRCVSKQGVRNGQLCGWRRPLRRHMCGERRA